MKKGKQAFMSEKRTLLTILIIFDLTYIVRAIWDNVFNGQIEAAMARTITTILCGAVFDLMPTALILLLHSKNLSQPQSAAYTE